MAEHDVTDRCIALAGLLQAVYLVQQTARGRMRDQRATRASIATVFVTDSPSVRAVFGNAGNLRTGLEQLVTQLGSDHGQRDLQLTGYLITLLHLERKLSRNPAMLEQLASGIERLRGPYALCEDSLEPVIPALAELYQQTVSNLTPRVMVQGEPVILASAESQQMIRALLLAAIRAAVLWRQCKGARWRLIFERRALLGCAQNMLDRLRDLAG